MEIAIEKIMARILVYAGGCQLVCPRCENERLSVKYVGESAEVYCLECENLVAFGIPRKILKVGK